MRFGHFLVMIFLTVSLIACDSNDEQAAADKVPATDIVRDGAIETVVSTEHLDAQHDVLLTTHKIWKNNVLVQQTTHTDTLPTLGNLSNSDSLRKDYEFYITVK